MKNNNIRQSIRNFLPPFLFEFIKKLIDNKKVEKFLNGEIVPWSSGYYNYWRYSIINALRDESLISAFRTGDSLPLSYGIGIDERCIEYPWLMSHLRDEPELLLDAGSTFNYDFILDQQILQHKTIHIMTLAPESNCFWHKGISYLFHDLRDIPVRDNYYDVIACLSTLEHVGCNTSSFTHSNKHEEEHPEDFILALHELRRVLKTGGTLFMTVPFGRYQYLEMQQQFDWNLLSCAINAFGKTEEVNYSFYRYGKSGWNISNAEECTDCTYVEWISKVWLSNEWPTPIPIEEDRAAAARAVSCMKLVKG